MEGPEREIQTRSIRVTRTFAAPLTASANFVLVQRNGNRVVGGENAIVAIDTSTGRDRWTVDLRSNMYEDPCPFLGIADQAGTFYCGSYFGQIEERNLSDGGRTGRTLDPQIGSVGDLAVSADGRELLAFAAQSGVVSRRRLDGSGPVTRLVARGRVATDGYARGVLPTSSRARLIAGVVPDSAAVWDPGRDKAVALIPGGADATWVGRNLVAAAWAHEYADLYDVAARRRVAKSFISRHVDGIWRSPDGSRVFTDVMHGSDRPTRFDVPTDEPPRSRRSAGRPRCAATRSSPPRRPPTTAAW